MRIRPLRAITSSAAAFAAALVLCGAIVAHGDETFFVAEPAVVAPGDAVGVRADLPTTGPVRLSVVGPDGTVRLVGVVEQTDGGHFEILIQVPADLPAGHWTLLAEVGGSAIATTPLEVAETAIGAELGGQGPRDEDDALLVPLPSGWQAAPSDPRAATASATVVSGVRPVDIVPFIGLGGAVVAFVLLVVRTRPSRPRGGPADRPR